MNSLQPTSEDEDSDGTVPPIEAHEVASLPILFSDNLSRLSIDSGHSGHSHLEGIDNAVVRAHIVSLRVVIRVYL
jgi:hypothetical protein